MCLFHRPKRDAADLALEQVGNASEAEKRGDLRAAGEAYEKAADLYARSPQDGEKTRYLLEAGRVYGSVDAEASGRVTALAIYQLVARGQTRRAANHAMALGDVYARAHAGPAIDWYAKAAEWYEEEHSTLLANKARAAYADLASLNGDPAGAALAYERVAKASLSLPTAGWAVKTFYIRAVMSQVLAREYEKAREARERFERQDREFTGSVEAKCLEAVVHSVAAEDLAGFEAALFTWDSTRRLDAWMLDASLKLKHRLAGTTPHVLGDSIEREEDQELL